jgi:hypothetical protein
VRPPNARGTTQLSRTEPADSHHTASFRRPQPTLTTQLARAGTRESRRQCEPHASPADSVARVLTARSVCGPPVGRATRSPFAPLAPSSLARDGRGTEAAPARATARRTVEHGARARSRATGRSRERHACEGRAPSANGVSARRAVGWGGRGRHQHEDSRVSARASGGGAVVGGGGAVESGAVGDAGPGTGQSRSGPPKRFTHERGPEERPHHPASEHEPASDETKACCPPAREGSQ